MADIAPELLEKIRSEFTRRISENKAILALQKQINAGKANYVHAEEYAALVGEELSQAFQKYITADVLPDGKLYYNIADRVLRPMLEEDHDLVSDAAAAVQKMLNEKAGIGIKPQKAPVNQDRIQGILDKLSDAEDFEDVAWVLEEPVINFSMNVVDDTIRKNADFHYKAGMTPKIIRRAEPGACKWCRSLAGHYDYPNVPDDVYRRHERCRCIVEYDPGNGKRQNVHTKQWTTTEERARLETRKILGLRTNGVTIQNVSKHAIERFQERGVLVEDVLDAIQNPLKVGDVKYDSLNRPSFEVIGRKATITVNPESGVLTTVHGTHRKTAEKLSRKKG